MFITEDIKEISRRERKHFLFEVTWGCQAWLFPAGHEWYVVYLHDTGEIGSQCGLVFCKAEDRLSRGIQPSAEDIKEEEKDMLDFLDGAFPCWKDRQ